MLKDSHDDNTWLLVSKVVSGHASEEELLQLSRVYEKDPDMEQVVKGLQAFWEMVPADYQLQTEIAFKKLEKRLGKIPD